MGNLVCLTTRRLQQRGLQMSDASDVVNVELSDWGIKRTNLNTTHVIGDAEDGHRVSSPIVEYDAQRQLARTLSGRYYALIGPETGGSENARLMWTAFKQQHGLVEV